MRIHHHVTDPYLISSAADWTWFANAVSNDNNDVAFTGGAFKGSYSYMEWAAGTTYKSILLLGANSKLFWPNGENVSSSAPAVRTSS